MRIISNMLVVCCLISLISCRGVHSVRPVPAEEDSVVDPQLIGMWRLEKSEELDTEHAFEGISIRIIARSIKSKKTMSQLSFLIPQKLPEEFKKDPENKQEAEFLESLLSIQNEIYIHRGKYNILSTENMTFTDEMEIIKKTNNFSISRYELKDENTLLLYSLDFNYLEKTVETKQLKGRLEQSKNNSIIEPKLPGEKEKKNSESKQTAKTKNEMTQKKEKGTIVSVILDDDPKKIIRYLEEHPEAFEKTPSVYKRMNYDFVKKKIERTEAAEKVEPMNPPVENVFPPENNKAKQSVFTRSWFSTFFLGLAAGVVFAIIAMLVSRTYKSRIAT